MKKSFNIFRIYMKTCKEQLQVFLSQFKIFGSAAECG